MIIMRAAVIMAILTKFWLLYVYYSQVINWEGRIQFKVLFFALKGFQCIIAAA